ncbi:MAG: DNA-processing protein DprA [Bacteroidetes bacterium]|nr:DNA-processing protein DprA [Bacteroidota bacterium]
MKKETVIELMAKASLPGVGPVTIRKVLAELASVQDPWGPARGAQNSKEQAHPGSERWVEVMLGADAYRLAAMGPWGQRLATAMNKDKDGRVLHNNLAFFRREWEIGQGEGIQWVDMNSVEYPNQLKHCTNAPLLLYVKGKLPSQYQYSIAVVGTRNMSSYGAYVLRHYMEELMRGWYDLDHKPLVVSGLARGVDTHAHELAIECGMVTLGVMANGLATIYPAQNRGLASRILKEGALISESPAHQSPDARLFASRNRIIAGICSGTLVAEAAARGGALITARYAQEYGRHVLAFPGRVTDQNYRGCLQMIMDGQALMTCSPFDLATLMKWPVRECSLEGNAVLNGATEMPQAVKSCPGVLKPIKPIQNLGMGASHIISSMELHESVAADLLWDSFPGDYSGFVCAVFELETKGWIARNATGALVRLR